VGNRWVWKRAAWKKIETPEALAKKAEKAAKKAEKGK
jgi:hypothetical protein